MFIILKTDYFQVDICPPMVSETKGGTKPSWRIDSPSMVSETGPEDFQNRVPRFLTPVTAKLSSVLVGARGGANVYRGGGGFCFEGKGRLCRGIIRLQNSIKRWGELFLTRSRNIENRYIIQNQQLDKLTSAFKYMQINRHPN